MVIIGLILLVKGADYLINGASSIARRFKISNLVIGLTIVAFGTSAPELIISTLASLQNNAQIAIGNILGSNIANILLVLGIAAIINPLKIGKNTVWKEIPLSLLAAIVLGIMVNDMLIDNALSSSIARVDGLILWVFFIIFMFYTFGIAKVGNDDSEDLETKKILGNAKTFLYIAGGLLGLFIGGKFVVDGAVQIAQSFGVSEFLIGLTIVAIGTSLPELVTSVVAALKKNPDIAVGNIVGSNILNVFFILGASAIVNPLPFDPVNNIDIIVTIGASLLLFLAMFVGKKHLLEKWQGASFLLIYFGYLSFLISRG
ncbi:calcium/sodium antiporter [Patescibacteria group bacterium]|nr:calcium/sodium antiporter [Patescibacteria group bacterium]